MSIHCALSIIKELIINMKNNINFFNLPSNIYIKDITKNINEFLPKKLPKKICAKISLGIHFASIRQIQTLNAKFRNKNTPIPKNLNLDQFLLMPKNKSAAPHNIQMALLVGSS